MVYRTSQQSIRPIIRPSAIVSEYCLGTATGHSNSPLLPTQQRDYPRLWQLGTSVIVRISIWLSRLGKKVRARFRYYPETATEHLRLARYTNCLRRNQRPWPLQTCEITTGQTF